MSFTSAKQLKDWIQNLSHRSGVPASTLQQSYLMERFMERVSLSSYRKNVILKGGFLIAAMIGADKRSTMDIDTTIKGMPMGRENVEHMLREVISINVQDNVVFEIVSIKSIHAVSTYEDFRISLDARIFTIRGNLKIDMTTGDQIIPEEIEYPFQLMFEDRKIPVMAYNLQTILAEKIEAILSRNVVNTRGRDFYDVYMLLTVNRGHLDRSELLRALYMKAQERNSLQLIKDHKRLLGDIAASPEIDRMWRQYAQRYPYAKDIALDDTMRILKWVFEID